MKILTLTAILLVLAFGSKVANAADISQERYTDISQERLALGQLNMTKQEMIYKMELAEENFHDDTSALWGSDYILRAMNEVKEALEQQVEEENAKIK